MIRFNTAKLFKIQLLFNKVKFCESKLRHFAYFIITRNIGVRLQIVTLIQASFFYLIYISLHNYNHIIKLYLKQLVFSILI